jgi:hypothetical protein
MPPRDNVARLIARAHEESDPDVLERIASRPFDALMDRAHHLRMRNSALPSPGPPELKSKQKNENG